MKKSRLLFYLAPAGAWHSTFRNNHGRKLYLKVKISDKNHVTILDCFYIDRPIVNGNLSAPSKQKTKNCYYDKLLDILAIEVDKRFSSIEFCDDNEILVPEEFIHRALRSKTKHKFLILIEDGDVLKTRLKNRVHRIIYLEIQNDVNRATISLCYYCDKRYKRDNTLITPAGIKTVFFDFSLDNIRNIINTELNCDFTDAIVTSDTFGFDKNTLPICGSI